MSAAKKPRCPPDTLFAQQKLANWSLDLSLYGVGAILIAIGIAFIPIGSYLMDIATNHFEMRQVYDGQGGIAACEITKRDEGTSCQVTFSLTQDVTGPVYLYYELENFYQNHARYFQSKSTEQLMGQNIYGSEVSLDCSPLVNNGTIPLNPCGLIANSFFNDVITINSAYSGTYTLNENGIALNDDVSYLYNQPAGFFSEVFTVNSTHFNCSQSGTSNGYNLYFDPTTSICYKYYYPDDGIVQYLYETYPGVISPILGVTDEHFIVWMRTEAMPTFRKLYGKLEGGNFSAGDSIVFDITANFNVYKFGGSKALIICTEDPYGNNAQYIGTVFVVTGTISVLMGLLYAAREFYRS